MKELKFRQAIFIGGKFHSWHYWGLIDNALVGISETCNPTEAVKNSQQYTGLRDKNSKEIYEEDILTCDGFERLHLDAQDKYEPVVSFDWHGACIKHNGIHIRLDMLHNWEVIGNIFENPELLKEAK